MSVLANLRSLRKRSWTELLQYVAVSLLIISFVGALFYAGMSWDFFSKWGMFAILTAAMSWFLVDSARPMWGRKSFWVRASVALLVHCLLWCPILVQAQTWKPRWFEIPMMIELALLLIAMDFAGRGYSAGHRRN